MAFGTAKPSITLEELLTKVSEFDVLNHYFGINTLPIIISSPLRADRNPSFGLHTPDGSRVYFMDFATRDRGGLWDLLGQYWGVSYMQVLEKVWEDLPNFSSTNPIIKEKSSGVPHTKKPREIDLKCKVRPWTKYDLEYWESFGISLEWLQYADIYPISHKIVIKNGHQYIFGADKYAYVFVEHKDNRVFLKFYQPFNKSGYKWSSNIDRSVWSLWTKIPAFGDNLILASSLKDCLNISANLGIPSICLQGEGYLPKEHVMRDLKSRYKRIIVFYDNDYTNPDNPGRKDSLRLSQEYNLYRIEIPEVYEAKDPSDLFNKYGKERYLEIMNDLLNGVLWKSGEE